MSSEKKEEPKCTRADWNGSDVRQVGDAKVRPNKQAFMMPACHDPKCPKHAAKEDALSSE
jgi:hypothetical protein